MFTLLVPMIREEWRIHATIFGTVGFALFPLLVLGFAWMGSFILPLFLSIVPIAQIALLLHGLFSLVGVMVGSFGTMGREFMNRRFGQASLLAYSSRTLPVTERNIFFNFFIKDVIYYFFLWIIPFVAGFGLASPFLGIGASVVLLLLLTVSLAFLIGLSTVFLFSTIYAQNRGLFAATLAGTAILILFLTRVQAIPLYAMLPPVALFLDPAPAPLLASMFLILVPSAISILFLVTDYPEDTKHYPARLMLLSQKLSWLSSPHLVAKDAIDLHRSEGGLGKIVFSFIFPVILIWVFFSVLLRFIPGVDVLIIFAVLLGIISSSMFNWLCEFDSLSAYAFLPVRTSEILKSKLESYFLLSGLPAIMLILLSAFSKTTSSLLPAMIAFFSVSLYALGVTVRLTGLQPNVMLYDARVFFLYFAAISPVLLVLIFVSVGNPLYVLAAPLLIPAALYLLGSAMKKWDLVEMKGY